MKILAVALAMALLVSLLFSVDWSAKQSVVKINWGIEFAHAEF